MFKINENYKKLGENYLFSEVGRRVRAYAAENPDAKIVRLGIGDVTLPLPAAATDAMVKASLEMSRRESFRGYAPEYGYDFLREAVSKYYSGFGASVAPEDVFVSDGAKSDIGNLTDILGDNPILIPDPVYPVYLDSNIMSGREIIFMPTSPENGFLPFPSGLVPRSYVIYICSPNNPTGAVFNRSGLAEWVNFAIETGSLIIMDSAYNEFISDTKEYPRSIYEIPGAEKCAVEVCSLSKTAGFTGTRCGWTVVPSALKADGTTLRSLWARRQATKFNGVSYVIQRAAEAVLSPEGISQCRELISYYTENARMVASLLREKKIFFTGGENSPYIWLKCPGGDSWEFFDSLLRDIQVVGTPGAGFGKCGEGYFRLTAFGSHEMTAEAVKRLANYL